ncbi:MAG: bifunctional pyr operon transcriptional regulator/uracil phosphoribosyltransferase PyrR [Desulfobacteraceae bacterium]|nr:bifunctional pyr operon transcriptional regulator/uracil phosphoribosyltransferase PyrR [Desulfobacteraceae bacterium]
METQREVLNTAGIEAILDRMSADILKHRMTTDHLALVGLHTRGVHLAKRLQNVLLDKTGCLIPSGDIDITLYRDDWTQIGHSPVVKATDIPFSVDGKEIVLVDDVLFTGRTIRAAMDALMDFGRPARIELAVLVDRGHRELPIQGNFTGILIDTDRTETVNVLLMESDGEDRVVIE